MPNEVISLQFGNYSNYIGTHYWNIQESQFVYNNETPKSEISDVNHDILFREGISTQNRLTYSPRMILFDMKENINFFNKTNFKGSQDKAITTWKGDVQIFESEKIESSTYSSDLQKSEMEEIVEEKSIKRKKLTQNFIKETYDMDQEVKYWSDYSKLSYNDRSFTLINKYQNSNSDAEPFDLFNYGLKIFDESSFTEEFEEKIRHFSEECDLIQGFQITVDAFNGFGGVCSKALNYVIDEYAKKPIFAFLPFPYYDDQAYDSNCIKLINSALTIQNLIQDNKDILLTPISLFDSLYLSKSLNPIQFDSLNYKPVLNYQTSGILASIIDSITLAWRQKSQKASMSDVLNLFDGFKYKIASVQSLYPLHIDKDKYLFNYLQENDLLKNSTWFTPFCSKHASNTDTSLVSGVFTTFCRGIKDNKVKNIKDDAIFKGLVPAHVVLDQYFNDMYPKSLSKCFSSESPLDISLPFPNVFNEISNSLSKNLNKNVSYTTTLQMNSNIIEFLKFMEANVKAIHMNKRIKYLENGLENEDFNDLFNFLYLSLEEF